MYTKMCGISTQCKNKWQAASAYFFHRALEPKVRVMERFPLTRRTALRHVKMSQCMYKL